MVSGIIRYWAAAKDAAGTGEETYRAENLAQALDAVRAGRSADDPLLRVLERSSFLVDEQPVGRRDHSLVRLTEGGVIEVLPPFAGG
ncbi:molybdopterin converting factor small subunit [Nocardiopsis mwathae]|uniref:Molybdopterin converting factor small subunit n=1 Tax=Nocardiopsis mwathae TaxID=1472723 RepID=A0A7W9YKV9_9ACTN|nr:MoaD/ThiS family protein [Nocardiopsis mwathae]MBB6173917.1 molybdopterin converting factor small subunit [Nocardiopsis mwathae]